MRPLSLKRQGKTSFYTTECNAVAVVDVALPFRQRMKVSNGCVISQKIRWHFSSVGKHRPPPLGFDCGCAVLRLCVNFISPSLDSYG
jgi:hypothetical protein